MGRLYSRILTSLLLAYLATGQADKIRDEAQARAWLVEYNQQAEKFYYNSMLAAWNYNTNITDHNQGLSVRQKHIFT